MVEPFIILEGYKVGYTVDSNFTPYQFVLRFGDKYRKPLKRLLELEIIDDV